MSEKNERGSDYTMGEVSTKYLNLTRILGLPDDTVFDVFSIACDGVMAGDSWDVITQRIDAFADTYRSGIRGEG